MHASTHLVLTIFVSHITSLILLLFQGVAQILNRLDRKTFNDADQRLFEVRAPLMCSFVWNIFFYLKLQNPFVWTSNTWTSTIKSTMNHMFMGNCGLLCLSQAFVIFCGLGINNTMMYNQVKKTWAKQSVALDVSWLASSYLPDTLAWFRGVQGFVTHCICVFRCCLIMLHARRWRWIVSRYF